MWKVIALLVAGTLCVGLAQRGQRRGQEGRGENAQAGQAAQQGTQEGEDFQEEGQEGPRGQQGNSDHVSPYILYGPHGYNTFTHSRCQEVPTVDVQLSAIKGDWYLIEYVNSHDGKPIGPNTPYLCPEARWQFEPSAGGKSMNISQISYEWPATFLDVVEWKQHEKKSGVFFHEEGVFSLWTMKVMDINPTKHMVFFLCIDYTIWPGWNHRGVYVLSRTPELEGKIKRKLSDSARRRMRMVYDRRVNTTSCKPDDFLPLARERYHPHKALNPKLITAPILPYISRNHRRNLKNLD